MAKRKPAGMVFISYAHADRERVEPLVRRLAAKFNVWYDRGLQVGETWRRTLTEKIDSARCLIVMWTFNSVKRDFIWSEVQRARENRGVVIPIKLDRRARVPLGFDQMQHIDLSGWSGREDGRISVLMERVAALVARPTRQRRTYLTLDEDRNIVKNSSRAAGRLLELSNEAGTLGGILIPGRGPTRDLLGSLEQVHRTFEAVSGAISTFLAPAADTGSIDVRRYLAMERGSLSSEIERRRGHCTRIVEYYGRVGGLRDWLVDQRLSPSKLKTVDNAFAELGESDNDLFADLSRIGDVLTEEASAIVGLLLAGQQKLARARIRRGRQKLLPLEKELRHALSRMQKTQSSLGYTPPAAKAERRKRRTHLALPRPPSSSRRWTSAQGTQ
jgi:hypothetical protein